MTMTQISSPIHALAQMLLHPTAVMKQVKAVRYWSWIPFLLQLVVTVGVSTLYFYSVDWSWYQQQFVLPSLSNLAPAEIEMALEFSKPSTFVISSAMTGLLFTPAIVAALAFYLSKMTQMDEDNIQGFTDWYGLCWWMQLPLVISALIGVGMIVAGSERIDPLLVLAPLSLANLASIGADSAWYNLASSVSLLGLWVMVLQYKGVRAWTKLGPLMTLLIVLLPYAVCYGIWLSLI
ncbi:YIP1 family protein [Ferrimonas lipolytica]|uniref:Yip1 domain-containing protein n=1 Tax=Ferrimonas lipolytica TaxID=2724191 RepID=A0A6H1UCK6_9GAMM|nr:YIP1 family protein [Ferrimonas lipolytica]QIZ76837.1 hypothetical protein HER31_08085 [Ferrimonas lipolytica]